MARDLPDLSIAPELREQLQESLRRMQHVWSRYGSVAESAAKMLQAHAAAVQTAVDAARPMLAEAERALQSVRTIAPMVVDGLRRALPPNWDPGGVRLRFISPSVADDGIPLAWVPGKAIVTDVLRAADRAERIRIITAQKLKITADCEACLAECTRADLAEVVHLADRALAAYKDGHHEAAQALAVVIAEDLITDFIAPSYKKAAQIAAFRGDIYLRELRRAIAIAPIPRFYTEWYPASGTPPPTALSRHATVHNPSMQQFSEENALLALMLVVSLLREITEWKRTGFP